MTHCNTTDLKIFKPSASSDGSKMDTISGFNFLNHVAAVHSCAN